MVADDLVTPAPAVTTAVTPMAAFVVREPRRRRRRAEASRPAEAAGRREDAQVADRTAMRVAQRPAVVAAAQVGAHGAGAQPAAVLLGDHRRTSGQIMARPFSAS